MTNKMLIPHFFIFILFLIDVASSISCYKCLSINGSNPSCEDLFQGDETGKPSLLSAPCLTRLHRRQGIFPATHCIKLVAHSGGPNSVRYTYRTCGRDEANDNGITRISHCGFVKLDWIDAHRKLRGCLHTCDKDTCNQTSHSIYSISRSIFFISLLCSILPKFSRSSF